MLLAYIDEVGETGAFVSRSHSRFNTSPAFGYAGFIVPAHQARNFGSIYDHQKKSLFSRELRETQNPAHWERKGSDFFRPETPRIAPQNLRVFDFLVRSLVQLEGKLFYYCDEKPLGTPKQTKLEPELRESDAMRETLNRIARYADNQGEHVMVIIDQINEKTRSQRLPNMYGHILARAGSYQEMKRIIEPPMHVDSQLSANIQFADWVAACVTRAIDFQLIEDSAYKWITDVKCLKCVRKNFTYESKLHLYNKSVEDFNNSDIFSTARRLYPPVAGARISSQIDPDVGRKMRAIIEKGTSGREVPH